MTERDTFAVKGAITLDEARTLFTALVEADPALRACRDDGERIDFAITAATAAAHPPRASSIEVFPSGLASATTKRAVGEVRRALRPVGHIEEDAGDGNVTAYATGRTITFQPPPGGATLAAAAKAAEKAGMPDAFRRAREIAGKAPMPTVLRLLRKGALPPRALRAT